MHHFKIAAQLYSFRDYIGTPAGVRDTFRRLKAIGYHAVQLSGAIAPMPERDLVAMLEDSGLVAPTSHDNQAAIINDTRRVIDRLLALGCRHTAYPYPHRMPTGIGETIALAEELNAAAEKFRAAGITLAYHNHSVEFAKFEGRLMLDLIYENAPLLEGEIDTYWVQKGGGSPTAWIDRLSGRMKVLHIKDYGMKPGGDCSASVMMPVGSGNLNWPEIFAAAERSGVEWCVVEHDGDVVGDVFDSFASSLRFLKQNFPGEEQ